MIRRFYVPALALATSLLLAAHPATAHGQTTPSAPADARSVAVEADAFAYALGGYSGILRFSLSNGFNIAVGAGRYNVPGFIVEGQDNYEQAEWKATAESIQVLRVGYRFGGAMKNGAVIDGIVINQRWKLEAQTLGAATKFSPIGVGVSGGYYYHFGRHFYVYPTASLTYNGVHSGEAAVQGLVYEVQKVQFNGSLHVGWEWSF